jgi:hypothetical protein
MNLFILFGCPPSTMAAVLAYIFDGRQANHGKHE